MSTDIVPFDYLYRATWQMIQKMYNEEAVKNDSNMTIGFVLINIHYNHGTPSTALGPKMGIEPTSLSRTLKNMEKLGLIYREPNPNDGRSVMIKLTDLGKSHREISKNAVIQFNNQVRSHLSEIQIKHFLEVTQKIQELIHLKKIY